jgi:hypothetical protein
MSEGFPQLPPDAGPLGPDDYHRPLLDATPANPMEGVTAYHNEQGVVEYTPATPARFTYDKESQKMVPELEPKTTELLDSAHLAAEKRQTDRQEGGMPVEDALWLKQQEVGTAVDKETGTVLPLYRDVNGKPTTVVPGVPVRQPKDTFSPEGGSFGPQGSQPEQPRWQGDVARAANERRTSKVPGEEIDQYDDPYADEAQESFLENQDAANKRVRAAQQQPGQGAPAKQAPKNPWSDVARPGHRRQTYYE